MLSWLPVVHVPPRTAAHESANATSIGTVAGAFGDGIPAAEFAGLFQPGRRQSVDWRCAMLEGHTALESLHEICDVAFGPSHNPPWRCRDAAAIRRRLNPGVMVEGTRRLLHFLDRHRRRVGRANAAQTAAIALAVMEDATSEALEWQSTGTACGIDQLADALHDSDWVLHLLASLRDAAGNRDSSSAIAPLVETLDGQPLPLARDVTATPLERREQAMPSWLVAGGIISAVGARVAAATLGFTAVSVVTRRGTWHVHAATLAPTGAGETWGPPIVFVHGLMTNSVSLLPLAALVAAWHGSGYRPAAVIVPDLLDADFGWSRSCRDGVADLDTDVGGSFSSRYRGGRVGFQPPLLTFEEHIEALHELFEEIVDRGGPLLNPCRHTLVDAVGHSFGGYAVTRIAASSVARGGGSAMRRPPPESCARRAMRSAVGAAKAGGNPRIRRVALLCPGGLDRYRVVACGVPLAGADAIAAVLASPPSTPAATPTPAQSGTASLAPISAAAAHVGGHVVASIAHAPFTSRVLASLDVAAFFAPPRESVTVIPQPSLLLWGRDDRLHKPWPSRPDAAMLDGLPRGLGYFIEGGDHGIIIDSAAVVASLTAAFLALPDGAALESAIDTGLLPPDVFESGSAQAPQQPALPLALRVGGAALWWLARVCGTARKTTAMRSHHGGDAV